MQQKTIRPSSQPLLSSTIIQRTNNKVQPTKGHSFLVWYSIDREDQETESVFLCKKHFFVEKTVSIQSALGAVYLDTNSLLVADVK